MNNKWAGFIVGIIIILALSWVSWQGSAWAVKNLGDFGKHGESTR